MNRHVFLEELISYKVKFQGTFPVENLRLTEEGSRLEYQLGEIQKSEEGILVRAEIFFHTSLEKGQKRSFVLEYNEDYSADLEASVLEQLQQLKTAISWVIFLEIVTGW